MRISIFIAIPKIRNNGYFFKVGTKNKLKIRWRVPVRSVFCRELGKVFGCFDHYRRLLDLCFSLAHLQVCTRVRLYGYFSPIAMLIKNMIEYVPYFLKINLRSRDLVYLALFVVSQIQTVRIS